MISPICCICGIQAAHLEQQDGLGSLVHLVDGIVKRRDEILDVGAIERGDKRAPHCGQHHPGELVASVSRSEITLQ
jgi:hypothetical protein